MLFELSDDGSCMKGIPCFYIKQAVTYPPPHLTPPSQSSCIQKYKINYYFIIQIRLQKHCLRFQSILVYLMASH